MISQSFSILGIEKQDGGIPIDSRWYVDDFYYKVDDYIGKKVKTVLKSLPLANKTQNGRPAERRISERRRSRENKKEDNNDRARIRTQTENGSCAQN